MAWIVIKDKIFKSTDDLKPLCTLKISKEIREKLTDIQFIMLTNTHATGICSDGNSFLFLMDDETESVPSTLPTRPDISIKNIRIRSKHLFFHPQTPIKIKKNQ